MLVFLRVFERDRACVPAFDAARVCKSRLAQHIHTQLIPRGGSGSGAERLPQILAHTHQICRFCWHRLRNESDGLCPACRRPFDDEIDYNPEAAAEMRREKEEKRQAKRKERQSLRETEQQWRPHEHMRILQRCLVYVIGLPSRLSPCATHAPFLRLQAWLVGVVRWFLVLL